MMTKIEQIMYKEAYEEAYEKASLEIAAEKSKRIISAIQMCKELGIDKLNVLKQLPDKFSISESEAKDYVQTVWN